MLKLRVRKWICREVSCSQRIFAERFPEVAQRYARMTDRLIKALQSLGVTTNGADAAQIAESLGMPTTAKTIIRRVLQLALPSEGEVAKVGIDEWAWKKGQTYATILVDLERHRIVDVLPDREAETLEIWLIAHPTVEVINRDRAGAYAQGARKGAPQAQQVADRFHLLLNLQEMLKRLFERKHEQLKHLVTWEPAKDDQTG